MRVALSGSALVHAGVLGLLLVGFVWPEADDAAAAVPVTVDIIPMSTVSSNSVEQVESDSTVSALSAGNSDTTIEAVTPDVVEPMTEPVEAETPEAIEPVTEPVEIQDAEPVEPEQVAEQTEPVEPPPPAEIVEPAEAEPLEMAELSSSADSSVSVAPLVASVPTEVLEAQPVDSAAPSTPVEPETTEAIEPVSAEELSTAPVPQQLSFQRPSKPIVHAPRPPTQQQPRPQQQPTPQTAGNGGNSQADSVAAAGGAQQQVASNGNGGSAEVARYPSQVIGKLRSALRRANGQAGEVVVRFTVLGNGQLSGVSVARSSGNGSTDQAGLALVQRAAPFPPIPVGAGRSDWTFDVPLAFGG